MQKQRIVILGAGESGAGAAVLAQQCAGFFACRCVVGGVADGAAGAGAGAGE